MRLLIVSGFLGSGKTTLLLALAERIATSSREKMVVIENEVSAQGVDDQYIREQGLDVRRIAGGCVCCALRLDLIRTLKQVQEAFDPEVVILEPSGVADASDVLTVVGQSRLEFERIDLIALMDAERFDAISRVCGPFFERSLRAADVVAINKIDLVEPAQVDGIAARIVEIDPEAVVVRIVARDGGNLDRLVEALDARHAPPAEAEHAHHHGERSLGETAVARRERLVWAPAVAADELLARLRTAHGVIARAVAARGRIGHIKTLLAANGRQVRASTTSPDREADLAGLLDGPVAEAEVTINAIVFGLDQAELSERVDELLGALQAHSPRTS